MSKSFAKSLSVYVHWPFCAAICPYCDFNVYRTRAIDEETYAAKFKQELDFIFNKTEPRKVASIFFGGGTPSLMSPKLISNIIDKIDALWGLEEDIEISLEANPEQAIDVYKDWRAAGVSRLSLGAQSLDDARLQFLGRAHCADQVRAAFAAAQGVFSKTSLDIIYATPQQTPQAWQAELAEILQLSPAHLSAYQLTIEPRTRFYKDVARNKFSPLAGDNAAELYEITQGQCAAAGLPAYEISNHAKDAAAQCVHNKLIWQGGDYIGIGCGAHGRISSGDKRFATYATPRPEDWLAQDYGKLEMREQDSREQQEERLLLGLRLAEGISIAELKKENITLPKNKLDELIELGFLKTTETNLAITEKGKLVLDKVILELIN